MHVRLGQLTILTAGYESENLCDVKFFVSGIATVEKIHNRATVRLESDSFDTLIASILV